MRTVVNPDGGTRRLMYPESAAWISNVPYRDPATRDPPDETLRHVRDRSVVIWAVIGTTGRRQPGARATRLDLSKAKPFPCCKQFGGPVSHAFQIYGLGPDHAYQVVVHVFYGSASGPLSRVAANRALSHLRLPAVAS